MDTLQELLANINNQQATQPTPDNLETLTSLIRQNMTAGLGIGPTGNVGFFNPEGGNAAKALGYAGPLRESDKPSINAEADIPVYNGASISPQTMQARIEAGGPFRGVVPDEKAQQLSQGISALAKSGAPAAVQGDVVQGILNKFGLGEASPYSKAYDIARGKAMGEASVAGTNKKGVNDVFSAAGKPEFFEAIAKASAEGRLTPTQEASAQRLHDQRVKTATPDQKMALSYENSVGSLKRLERLGERYDKAIEGKGDLSQSLKLSFARNANMATFLSPDGPKLPIVKNLTDDEVKFVTELNSMLIGMRQMYDDNRMSDQDVQNFLRALGDPKTGPQMFKAQLDATGNTIYDRGDAIRSAFKATRKNMEGLSPLEWKGRSPAKPAKSGASNGEWTVVQE